MEIQSTLSILGEWVDWSQEENARTSLQLLLRFYNKNSENLLV